MDLFTNSDVRRLAAEHGAWCVSMFLPTHRTGTEMQQDPIRLKNLLREAENQLLAAGLRKPDVSKLLAPAEELLGDRAFWQHQADGLAVFAGENGCQRYRVPLRLLEQVIVARRFQLKPLFPLLSGDGHFYVLALSQNQVRLLEGTRHSVDELELAQLPENFRQAVGLEDLQKQLQFHTRAADRGGQRAAMFHGQGPGDEVTKELLAKYFRQIDQAVCEFLRGDQAPLVLAGVDYYFPLYRGVSRYPRLVGEGVPGNFDKQRPEELHERAWSIVEPIFRADREAAFARFRQLAGTGKTSIELEEALLAANQGRVDTLFVATDRSVYGVFDPESRQVLRHESSTAENEDLTDRAALEAYIKAGAVFAVPAAELPAGESLAAIYRF